MSYDYDTLEEAESKYEIINGIHNVFKMWLS